MAKTNMVEREKRRAKIVKQYAAKRAQLKELIRSPNTSPEEREKAEKRIMERFEKLGFQLMHRSGTEMEGRAYTASMVAARGTPVLGATPHANLWLNVGHGALGFTLALATGRILADLAAGRPGAVPLDGFTLH